MKTWDMVEDLDELIKPFEDEEISVHNQNVDKANAAVAAAAQKIGTLQEGLKFELEMNIIASKEALGWAVVKEMEQDPMFVDDEDGSKTKNLKEAVKKASKSILQKKNLQRSSFGGRGRGFRGGRGGYRGVQTGYISKFRQPYSYAGGYGGGDRQQYVFTGGDGQQQQQFQSQQNMMAQQGLQANSPICWKSVSFFLNLLSMI
jgi:hypothetical protein